MHQCWAYNCRALPSHVASRSSFFTHNTPLHFFQCPHAVPTLFRISISIPPLSSTNVPMLYPPYFLTPYLYLRYPPPMSPCCTHPISYLHFYTSVILHQCPHAVPTLFLISIYIPPLSSTNVPMLYPPSPFLISISIPPLSSTNVPMLYPPYFLSPYLYLRSPPPMSPCCTHPISYLHIYTSVILHQCPHAVPTLFLISISIPPLSSTNVPMLYPPYFLSPYLYLRSSPSRSPGTRGCSPFSIIPLIFSQFVDLLFPLVRGYIPSTVLLATGSHSPLIQRCSTGFCRSLNTRQLY